MNTSTIDRNAVDYFCLTRLQRHNIIVYVVLKRFNLYFNRVQVRNLSVLLFLILNNIIAYNIIYTHTIIKYLK